MPASALNSARDVHRERGTDLAARGLGMLSLMLGAVEITGARALAPMLGIRGQERFIQLCGAREILQGAAILSARDPAMWVWVRVAGDALDIGTLAVEHYMAGRRKTRNMALALAAVAAITALDVLNARRLSREKREPRSARIDFSTRSGLPQRAKLERRGRARSGGNRGFRPQARLHSRRRDEAQPAEAM